MASASFVHQRAHEVFCDRRGLVLVCRAEGGAVGGDGVVHDGGGLQHVGPQLLPDAVVLVAGDVELEHLDQRQLLPALLVDALETPCGEVDERAHVVAVQAQAVDDHLERADVDGVDGNALRAPAELGRVQLLVDGVARCRGLHAQEVEQALHVRAGVDAVARQRAGAGRRLFRLLRCGPEHAAGD